MSPSAALSTGKPMASHPSYTDTPVSAPRTLSAVGTPLNALGSPYRVITSAMGPPSGALAAPPGINLIAPPSSQVSVLPGGFGQAVPEPGQPWAGARRVRAEGTGPSSQPFRVRGPRSGRPQAGRPRRTDDASGSGRWRPKGHQPRVSKASALAAMAAFLRGGAERLAGTAPLLRGTQRRARCLSLASSTAIRVAISCPVPRLHDTQSRLPCVTLTHTLFILPSGRVGGAARGQQAGEAAAGEEAAPWVLDPKSRGPWGHAFLPLPHKSAQNQTRLGKRSEVSAQVRPTRVPSASGNPVAGPVSVGGATETPCRGCAELGANQCSCGACGDVERHARSCNAVSRVLSQL